MPPSRNVDVGGVAAQERRSPRLIDAASVWWIMSAQVNRLVAGGVMALSEQLVALLHSPAIVLRGDDDAGRISAGHANLGGRRP
jgi:hypothetical protein